MTTFTQSQIEGAKTNAQLHGFDRDSVTDEMAIAFLTWYHASRIEYKSEIHAIEAALSGAVPNGTRQQEAFWSGQVLPRV